MKKLFFILALLLAFAPAHAQETGDTTKAVILILVPRSHRNLAFTAAMPFEQTVIESQYRQGNIVLPNRTTRGFQAQMSYWHTLALGGGTHVSLEAGLGGGAHSIGFRTEKLNDFVSGQNLSASPVKRSPYAMAVLNAHADFRLVGNMSLDAVAGVQYRKYLPFPLNSYANRLNDSVLATGAMWNNPTQGDLKLHLGVGVMYLLPYTYNILRLGLAYDVSRRRNIDGSYWLMAGTPNETIGLFHSNGNGMKVELSYIFSDRHVVTKSARKNHYTPDCHDIFIGYARQLAVDKTNVEQPADFYVAQQRVNFLAGGKFSLEYGISDKWRIGAEIGKRQQRILYNYAAYANRGDQRTNISTEQEGISLYAKRVFPLARRWMLGASLGGSLATLPMYKTRSSGTYTFNTYSEQYQFFVDKHTIGTADIGAQAEFAFLPNMRLYFEAGYHQGFTDAMRFDVYYKATPTDSWHFSRFTSKGSYWGLNIGVRYKLSHWWR